MAKNKLDTLYQNKHNYWFWKIKFNKLIIKTNKIKEQKMDLFKKNISFKIKNLAFTFSHKIDDANYKS